MGRKKASAKQDAAALRRQKRRNRQNDKESEGDETEMKIQLEKLGLALKEISGDGNCLFRALADQMYGNSKAVGGFHLKLRREVVSYMRLHQEDFAPFVDEEITFAKHLDLLEQDGTYAGQDALVAFARLYGVTIVIHQLNEPLWQIHGSSDGQTRCQRELHISYHNGDHYNSVRKIGDLFSNEPANLKIDVVASASNQYEDADSVDEDALTWSDSENDRKSSTANGTTSSSLWGEEGSGTRIFGDEISKAARGSAKPTKPEPEPKLKTSKKKLKSSRKNKSDHGEDPCITLVPTMQTLSL